MVLEGKHAIGHALYASGPIIDLGLRRHPRFREGIFHDLQPRDRLALWVVLDPPRFDPVCGMATGEGFLKWEYKGRIYRFCAAGCLKTFKETPEAFRNRDGLRGKYDIAFYDTKTGKSVLKIPVLFNGKESENHGEHRH